MNEIKGAFDALGRRFAIVASSFNEVVVGKLVEGALACFRAHGISEDDLLVAWVPGAFELPLVAKRVAQSWRYDAVICLGAVIRGETAHFEHVASQAAWGIQQVSLETGVPVAFGVLTTETLEQALDRAGGKHGNKGWDAAMAAMQMASVLDQLEAGVQGGSSPAERSGADQAAAVPLAEAARRRRGASGRNKKEAEP
ncbi:MAG TPA: 6,7-dimethyl-8-ribityllumazine synthase [Actinomycetota bacterium]